MAASRGQTQQLLLEKVEKLEKAVSRPRKVVYNPATKAWFARVLPWVYPLVASLLYLPSKAFLRFACRRVDVHNLEVLERCLRDRAAQTSPGGPRGLITVANHLSNIDDPLLWGILPLRTMLSFHKSRWCWGADDICFTKAHHSILMGMGKVLSIKRGGGLEQAGVLQALDVLNGVHSALPGLVSQSAWGGGWLHMFSEGRVNQSGTLLRLKWGVGKLIARAEVPPLVLPFYHKGLEDVMPLREGGKWDPYLRPDKVITVVFGEPLDFTAEVAQYQQERRLANKGAKEGDAQEDLRMYKFLTDRIEQELRTLEERVKSQHPSHPLQSEE